MQYNILTLKNRRWKFDIKSNSKTQENRKIPQKHEETAEVQPLILSYSFFTKTHIHTQAERLTSLRMVRRSRKGPRGKGNPVKLK